MATTTRKNTTRKTADVDTTYADILAACQAALVTADAARQLKQGKASLASMADRLKAAGVTADVVKAARETFSLTLHSVLGLPQPERSKGAASTDPVVRMLVKGMAEAVKIDKERLAGVSGNEQRRALYAAPMKALQRLSPPAEKKATKPADVFEAAQAWGEKLHKEFTNFRPASLKDKEFQRFAQVLFDALTMEPETPAA